MKKAFTLVELMIVIVIVGILAAIVIGPIGGCAMGVGGFGPENMVTCKVISKHVDVQKSSDSSSSHFMVGTDKGTFEVDNGLFLRVWNADEIYGRLEIGKTYTLKTKGAKVVNMFIQEYPYIVAILNVEK